jgi:hypothetical protein
MSFESNIQQWVALDNQIKMYSDKVKQLREQKNALADNLMTQADNNGYKNSVIQISDGRLRFADTRVTAPLTFRYIDDTLSTIIPNPESREQILTCLKTSRQTKVVTELKRYGNTTTK